MKIEADVLGCEQAVNFDTMETTQVVVLHVLGEVIRVPISEEMMERLTVAAVRAHTDGPPETAFEETRERSESLPSLDEQVRLAETPEREFSVMEGLSEMPSDSQEAPGFDGIFGGGEDEEAKIEALRRRPPPIMSMPRDPDGAPAPMPSSGLPRLPMGPVRDDDFPQG